MPLLFLRIAVRVDTIHSVHTSSHANHSLGILR